MSIVDELGQFEKPRLHSAGIASVSKAGISSINDYLHSEGYPHLPQGFLRTIDSRMGKVTTRARDYMRAYHGIKLNPDVLETIGNIADQHVYHGRAVVYDLTYEVLTWEPNSFGNRDSCWRKSYASSIPMFKMGTGYGSGFAIRLFRPDFTGPWYDHSLRGYGRCWGMPIATDALLLFNPYGEKLPVFSSIVMSLLPDGAYVAKSIEAGNSNEGIYMNGSKAVMVAPKNHDLWMQVANSNRFSMNIPEHYTKQCQECGTRFGTMDKYQRVCDKCGCTCAITGRVWVERDMAHVHNVNISYDDASYFIPEGFLHRDIAGDTLDFCFQCMTYHGNLDTCDARS